MGLVRASDVWAEAADEAATVADAADMSADHFARMQQPVRAQAHREVNAAMKMLAKGFREKARRLAILEDNETTRKRYLVGGEWRARAPWWRRILGG